MATILILLRSLGRHTLFAYAPLFPLGDSILGIQHIGESLAGMYVEFEAKGVM